MASQTTNALAKGALGFGPGELFAVTSTGFIPAGQVGATGTGTYLGRTGAIELSLKGTYTDLTTSQTGTTASGKGLNGAECMITTTLKEPDVAILEKVNPLVEIQRNTANDIKATWGISPIGLTSDNSQNSSQYTFIEWTNGKPDWSVEGSIIDFWKVASLVTDTKFGYDAENQRELAISLYCYSDDATLSPDGYSSFFRTRVEP